jgi:hypothetical protein
MKFIIMWNVGYGNTYDVVDVKDKEEAEREAYESWKEDAESQGDYEVTCEWSEEAAEEYGVS